MLRIFLCIVLMFGFVNPHFSQKKVDPKAPVLDQKKIAKAKALIDQAMKAKDKAKQSELLNESLALYSEMKMAKEGNLEIGDAFYNTGDLKTAARYYAKGGKENKAQTSEKVGSAYLEEAFKETDPKLQKKAFDNAFKNLSKAHGPNEANRIIGNEFFNMGENSYPKALEYYEKGGYKEGIYMIGDLYAARPENIDLASETYIRAKDKEGYRKAGDLYFNKGDYVKAMDKYATGGVIEGYVKYASELKKAGKIHMYNTVCEIITDTLKAKGKTDDIQEIAVQAERENNFPLAASLYKKLGNKELEQKYTAYMLMMNLEVIPAKDIFKAMGKEDVANDIDKNIKQLTDLQQSMLNLKEFQKNVPKVATKPNAYNGKLEYDANDVKLRDQYYGNPATQKGISEVVYNIGKTFGTLRAGEELKGLTRQALQRFKPVKNILDSYDLTKKILPINITPAAVTF